MGPLIGFTIVFVCVLGGYALHGGPLPVLWQPYEYIIIGGAAIGSMVAASGPKGFMKTVKASLGAFKPNPYTKERYLALLATLYLMINKARAGGMRALEEDIESPEASEMFSADPFMRKNKEAMLFLTDTMKVLMSGAIEPHYIDQSLDLDLDRYKKEITQSSHELKTVAEALPAFGIVAAVLGVIYTMGYIGGEASQVGAGVAAALVGTLLGVLLGYGVAAPLAQVVKDRADSKLAYLNAIKMTILVWQQKQDPMNCVEWGRRTIKPSIRPTFDELDNACSEAKSRLR